MRWWQYAAVVWLVASCAHPATPSHPPRANPDDTPDVPATGPIRFRYDWPTRRAGYREYVAKSWSPTPCRETQAARSSPDLFAYPKGPDDMAALVTSAVIHDDGETLLVLDRGRRQGVDETWSGALLDDDGHAVSEWTCVQMTSNGEAALVVPRPLHTLQRFKHVALFQEPPPLSTPR